MEIFVHNIAFAITPDDLTIEFAKILHKPPFPSSPLLNFEIDVLNGSHSNGRRGILALPTEDAGNTLLRIYGGTGIVVNGRQLLLGKKTPVIHRARVKRLNDVPWCDPVKLREEKERLLERNKHFE